MADDAREFDIVLYGATGFVGKLTAAYLASVGGSARIALAGRSEDRLRAVRDDLGPAAAAWPLVIADATRPETLAAMAERARVVVSTVGPYAKYGLPLVAACAEAGTDYADLTGEPNFIRASIDQFHKQAVDTGARIVHSCGFDSIPSDISVYALFRRAQDDGAGELGDTDLVVRKAVGGVSGGTASSIIELMRATSADADLRRLLEDPYTLTPDRGAEPDLGTQSDAPWRRGEQIAPELAGSWTGAFFMASANTRLVRRSNALLDWAYGRRFRYSESVSVGSSVLAPVAAAALTGVQNVAMAVGSRYFRLLPRRLVERLAPTPGTGPSEQVQERGHYRIETYTRTGDGSRYRATIAQQGDPGYRATAVLLAESALGLALDRSALSPLHGVLTPASALGDVLLARLPAAGVTLDVDRLV